MGHEHERKEPARVTGRRPPASGIGVETALFAAAVLTCAAFLFGGFGEAGSFHLASAFN